MSPIGEDGNKQDRALGEYWEDRFIEIARSYGWEAWAFSRLKGSSFAGATGYRYISPDVWLLRRGDRQYACEVKHKDLAANGCYGFERYREESMLKIERDYSNQFGQVTALYVVHNHAQAGGKWARVSNEAHWHAGLLSMCATEGRDGRPQRTYFAGRLTDEPVAFRWYPYRLFQPLSVFLCHAGPAA